MPLGRAPPLPPTNTIYGLKLCVTSLSPNTHIRTLTIKGQNTNTLEVTKGLFALKLRRTNNTTIQDNQ